MHLWQFANAPLENDDQFKEGSCEYASYLYLQNRSELFAEFLIDSKQTNADPIYGEGFRLVFDFVEKNGHYTWLDYLRKNKTAPW